MQLTQTQKSGRKVTVILVANIPFEFPCVCMHNASTQVPDGTAEGVALPWHQVAHFVVQPTSVLLLNSCIQEHISDIV